MAPLSHTFVPRGIAWRNCRIKRAMLISLAGILKVSYKRARYSLGSRMCERSAHFVGSRQRTLWLGKRAHRRGTEQARAHGTQIPNTLIFP